MAQYYNLSIDKNTDWGGDKSTQNLPVSGKQVLNFIKRSLNSKFGYIKQDGNRTLLFTDEDSYNKYVETGDESLILGNIGENPFEIIVTDRSTPVGVILKNSSCILNFTYDIKEKGESGLSQNEDLKVNIVFTDDYGIQTSIERTYNTGSVYINISDYLKLGSNSVLILLKSSISGTSRQWTKNYQVIDLDLSLNMDNFGKATVLGNNIEIPLTISGLNDNLYLRCSTAINREIIPLLMLNAGNSLTDVLSVSPGSVILRIPTNQNEIFLIGTKYGILILLSVENEGSSIKSNIIYYEVPISGGVLNTILCKYNTNEKEFFDNFKIKEEQFNLFNFNWCLYDTSNRELQLEIYINNELLLTVTTNGESNIFEYVPTKEGNSAIRFSNTNKTLETYSLVVQKNSGINISEYTQGLILKLSAFGRTNSDNQKDVWNYGEYETTFNNFNWNEESGWNNDYLTISNGATAIINCKPLNNITNATIELEFQTYNAKDDTSKVIDCTSEAGKGFYVTSNKAVLQVSDTETVSTNFKPGDLVKVAFIINSSANLISVVVDGVISGILNTNFGSGISKNITLGNENCGLRISTIRIYNIALTNLQELNHYILDGKSDLLNRFYRNDLLTVQNTLNLDKIKSILPTMIIEISNDAWNEYSLNTDRTNNPYYPIGVEYTNPFDSSRNFLSDGINRITIRKQGTSSMEYPIPNIRMYLNKPRAGGEQETISGENIITKNNKFYYSFKDKAQYVDVFTLKADFAESSMTHNTGVARIWNDLMYNVLINNLYVCRTKAQKDALLYDDYKNLDIRTTVDGFPMMVFRRESKDSTPIFVGQYNFNNDKSTESVFGWFDSGPLHNPKAECWEIRSNSTGLTQMTSSNNWIESGDLIFLHQNDGTDIEAYECRHYSEDNPNYEEGNRSKLLKQLVDWVVNTKDSPSEFEALMGNHLDLYKVAAYYIYLMRFGAVDQAVKNAMLTTDDGEHWYYINYDNDTILGLNNDGIIAHDYKIDMTNDSSIYTYSSLWKNLRLSNTFMNLVYEMDRALFLVGLSYNNVIDMFENKQAGQWSEIIYNLSQEAKYINIQEIQRHYQKLQGNRKNHRRWWLSNRFNLYDAKFMSNGYMNSKIGFKLDNMIFDPNEQVHNFITVKASEPFIYGWGSAPGKLDQSIEIQYNDDPNIQFTTTRNSIIIGDPVSIYAAPKLETVNLSRVINKIQAFDLSGAYDFNTRSSRLKNLIFYDLNIINQYNIEKITGTNYYNTTQQAFDIIPTLMDNDVVIDTGVFENLETININGMGGISEIKGSNTLIGLRNFYASTSGLTKFVAPKVNLINLELPLTLQELELDSIQVQNFVYTPNATLNSLKLKNIKNLQNGLNDKTLVFNWINSIPESDDVNRYLEVSGINWQNISSELLLNIANKVQHNLSGIIYLNDQIVSNEILNEIINIFGNSVFLKDGKLRIIFLKPLTILIKSDEILEEETKPFLYIIISSSSVNYGQGRIKNGEPVYNNGVLQYYLINYNNDETIGYARFYPDSGELVASKINSETLNVIPILIEFSINNWSSVITTFDVNIKRKIYADSINITGETVILEEGDYNYTYALNPDNISILYDSITAELIGGTTTELLSITHNPDKKSGSFTIRVNSMSAITQVLYLNFNLKYGYETLSILSSNISVLNSEVIASTTGDYPELAFLAQSVGWSDSNEFTSAQAAKITENQFYNGLAYVYNILDNANINSFDFTLFKYFIKISNIRQFSRFAEKLTKIELPSTATNIDSYAFDGCTKLEEIKIPNNCKNIGSYVFRNCTFMKNVYYETYDLFFDTNYSNTYSNPGSITDCNVYAGNIQVRFSERFITSDSVENIGKYAIRIPDGISVLKPYTFYNYGEILTLIFPEGFTTIKNLSLSNLNIMFLYFPNSIINIESNYACTISITEIENIELLFRSYNWSKNIFCSDLNNVAVGNVLYDYVPNTWLELTNIVNNLNYITELDLSGRTTIYKYGLLGFTFDIINLDPNITLNEGAFYEYKNSNTSIILNNDVTSRSTFRNCILNKLQSPTMRGDSQLYSATINTLDTIIKTECNLLSVTNLYLEDGSDLKQSSIRHITNLYISSLEELFNVMNTTYSGAILNTVENLYINNTKIGESLYINIESIPNYAFYGFDTLKYVTLGNNVKNIGNYAFLGDIDVDFSQAVNIENIGYHAFERNTTSTIQTLDLPNLKTIELNAFYNCVIKTFKPGDSVTEIPQICNLINNLYLTLNVKKVWSNLEIDNFYFTNINHIFTLNRTTLSGIISFNNRKFKIFLLNENEEYDQVRELTAPENITSISAYCFYKYDIDSINLNNISVLGEYAFLLSTLKNVILGSNILSIPNSCFSGCPITTMKYNDSENFDLQRLQEIGFRGLNILEGVNNLWLSLNEIKYLSLPSNITNLHLYNVLNIQQDVSSAPNNLYIHGNFPELHYDSYENIDCFLLYINPPTVGTNHLYIDSNLTVSQDVLNKLQILYGYDITYT